MKIKNAIAVLMMSALAGCGSMVHIHSIKAADYTGSPKKILVVMNPIPATGWSPEYQYNFSDRFSDIMKKCTVETLFLKPGENNGELAWMTKKFRPDAVMQIQLYEQTNAQDADGQYVSTLRYEVTLKEKPQGRNVWKSLADLGAPSSPLFVGYKSMSYEFADKLAGRMVADGILKSCPQATTKE
jgi:hypothetical protein